MRILVNALLCGVVFAGVYSFSLIYPMDSLRLLLVGSVYGMSVSWLIEPKKEEKKSDK